MTARQRVLSIAAASGRVGYVLLVDRKISTWGLSRKASANQDHAATRCANWIERLRPDVVVTERVLNRSKKGARTRAVIAAMTEVAEIADVRNIVVSRMRTSLRKPPSSRRIFRRSRI